ncbi:hypothetical protein BGW38_005006, partial [Lunasporangiospora selenospora]
LQHQQSLNRPPPPPPTHQNAHFTASAVPPPVYASNPIVSTAASDTHQRPSTPESVPIFLPGDSSRLLLSQGLYKVVPDAEDVEEARRGVEAETVAKAIGETKATGDNSTRTESGKANLGTATSDRDHAGASTAMRTSKSQPALDLNLGGDFLSSVINFESQEERFQALNAAKDRSESRDGSGRPLESATPAPSSLGSRTEENRQGEGLTAKEFQEYKREPGYHDRLAGQKSRVVNSLYLPQDQHQQHQYSFDSEKQEFEELEEYEAEDGHDSSNRQEIVIVGSDIVFEPLPSVKAAAKAKAEAEAAESAEAVEKAKSGGNPGAESEPLMSVFSVAAATASSSSYQNETTPPTTGSLASIDGNSRIGTPSHGSRSELGSMRRPPAMLERKPTMAIGEGLPTIGTEEYLERTDDKEEYSFGLHGDMQSIAGAEALQKSQGEDHESKPGSTLVSTFTVLNIELENDIGWLPGEAPAPAEGSTGTPPPIARATKPKVGSIRSQ